MAWCLISIQPMTFHDDAFGSYLWMDLVDELDYYFIYGPEFDQIIATIRTLTGTSPMLPKWAFGYIQSKERYAYSARITRHRQGIPGTTLTFGLYRSGLAVLAG